MSLKILPAISCFFMALCLFCGKAQGKAESIQIKGSDTMVNLGQAWAETYMEHNPGAFISLTGGGSGTGIASLICGTCDIAESSRKMSEKEMDLAQSRGINPREFIVALDGIVIVVNPENPVDEITLDQLAGLFARRIKNWKEIGGKDAPVLLLSREVNSGTHFYFRESVLMSDERETRSEISPTALLMPSSQSIADEVASNPNAIGYYGIGYAGTNQKILAIAKDADSPYIYPRVETVSSGEYPISRPMFMYTNGQPEGVLKDFMDFILGETGQRIVLEQDFVPFN